MIPRKRLLASVGALAVLLVPMSAQAAVPISVQILLGDACVSGTGAADKNVSATLRTPSGEKRDAFTTTSDSSGTWQGCFSLFLPTTTINGGDVLHVTVGGATRTLTVPRLMPSIDRVADTISGRTEPNTQVQVLITHHPNFRKSPDFAFSAVSDGQGSWTVDTTGTVNLIGEDEVTVLTQIGADEFGALDVVPYVLVSAVNDVVSGVANVGAPVSFTLVDRHGVFKGSGDGGDPPYGVFSAGLVDANDDAVYPVGGDTLTSNLAADASLRMPVGRLRGNAATDVVTGRCMANAPYFLSTDTRVYTGRTHGDGTFTRVLPRKDDIRVGDPLHLACMYPTGDVWVRTAYVN